MDDQGLPETVDQRLRLAERLVVSLTQAGVAIEDIYLDPLVRPVSTDPQAAKVLWETIRLFKENWSQAHIICGLSNISYGYPLRRFINQAFLVMALEAGLDAAILDPLDQNLMGLFYASQLLLGKDEFGMNSLKDFRTRFF